MRCYITTGVRFSLCLAMFLALPFAIYTFAGVEFVAVTCGEARSTEEIKRAVWRTFLVLALVYLGAIVVLDRARCNAG